MSDQDSKYAESLVSQEDLDNLLKEASEVSEVSEESKDLDLVSPEDIEKLLGSGNDREEESDLNQISRDDIEELVSGEELGGEENIGEDSDDSLISQDDIDALLDGGDKTGESSVDMPVESNTDLIDQDDIDALLDRADSVGDKAGSVGEEDSGETLISQDDIDALLDGGGEADTPEPDLTGSEDALISQDDIDSLLQDEDAVEGDDDIEQLITQDDIDKLLTDDSPVESATGTGLTDTGESLVSQDEIEKLLNADETEGDEEESSAGEAESNQVVLEKSDTKADGDSRVDLKKILKSKLLVGVAAGVVICIITGLSIILMMAPEDNMSDEADTAEIVQQEHEIPSSGETLDESIGLPVETVYVSVEMKDFVVPAPASVDGVSYLSLDIALEIADVGSDPIKGYEPFFRNIIYEMLIKAFAMQEEAGIVEGDIIKMIKDALNDALSEGSIEKIDFLTFNVK